MKFSTINNAVWNYMLTSTATVNVSNLDNDIYSIYPNPTTSMLCIQSNKMIQNKTYIVQSVSGQTILSGKIENTNKLTIDLSTVENGIYFVTIGEITSKVIKQ